MQEVKRGIFSILFGLVLILGFLLRTHNLYVWPRLGATFDEYAWTWQGINLIQNGVPKSWSPHALYTNVTLIKYQGAYFRLVSPYLEHPPMFGLVAGSYALLNGVSDTYDLDVWDIRGLAVILGIISIGFVFLLTKKLYGTSTALLASFLYSIIPTIVVGSRLVQNENFVIPIWLASLLVTAINLEKKKLSLTLLGGLLCAVAILAKLPFVAVGLSIIGIYLINKRYKDAIITSCFIVAGFLGFVVYGFYYDKVLFLDLLKFQSQRYDLLYDSVYSIFRRPLLVDRSYTDGWIYWGWISFFLLALKDFKKNSFIIIASLSYLAIYVAGIPDEPGHGWYRYPFYPFLIISISLFLKEYFTKNILLTFFFLLFVGSSLLQLSLFHVFGFSFLVLRGAIILWGVTLLPIFFPSKKVTRVSRITSYILLISYFLCSIWAILIYNEQ